MRRIPDFHRLLTLSVNQPSASRQEGVGPSLMLESRNRPLNPVPSRRPCRSSSLPEPKRLSGSSSTLTSLRRSVQRGRPVMRRGWPLRGLVDHVTHLNSRPFRNLHRHSPPSWPNPVAPKAHSKLHNFCGNLLCMMQMHRLLLLALAVGCKSDGADPHPHADGSRSTPPRTRSRRSCRSCSSGRRAALSRFSSTLTPSINQPQREPPGGAPMLRGNRVSGRC
jgi:hypothetical protein